MRSSRAPYRLPARRIGSGVFVAAILHGVVGGLDQSNPIQARRCEPPLEHPPGPARDVLGRGHLGREGGDVAVQEAPIEHRGHPLLDEPVQASDLDQHPGRGVERTAHGHLQAVVVAVAGGVGALAVDLEVLGIAPVAPGEDVRRAEAIAASESRQRVTST
jgi:hypothetical protein